MQVFIERARRIAHEGGYIQLILFGRDYLEFKYSDGLICLKANARQGISEVCRNGANWMLALIENLPIFWRTMWTRINHCAVRAIQLTDVAFYGPFLAQEVAQRQHHQRTIFPSRW